MADDLGFWLAIFQPDPSRNKVKAWIDGEENYQLFQLAEFIDLGDKVGIGSLLRQACREYSFFLWKVREGKLSRISFKDSPESLRKELYDLEKFPEEKQSIDEKYFKSDISEEASLKIKS